MASSLRKASAGLRERIVEALSDSRRRFLDPNTPSGRHLEVWGLTAEGLYADLAEGLWSDRLFLKPKTFPDQPQRYQCRLVYPEECGCPELDIHVTLSPKGEPLRVKVAVHKSDTVQRLPELLFNPPSDENETIPS